MSTENRRVVMEDPGNLPAHRSLVHAGVRYAIGHQIARGSFSTVYKARDEWGNALVAKVYNAESDQALWRAETFNHMQLRHPHIVALRAGFELEGKGWLVMDHAGIGVGRVVLPDAAKRATLVPLVAKGMLEALHFIHVSGYLHTDINPGNVLLQHTPAGRPLGSRLCDLALAVRASELTRGRPTADWSPPPEKLEPSLGELGPAMDVYAAALVLLQLLLGEDLPRLEPQQIVQGEARARALAVGGELGHALAMALAPAPADRVGALALWRILRGGQRSPSA